MENLPRKSETWHERAEEYRACAEAALSAAGRVSYRDLAKRCEQIAVEMARSEAVAGQGAPGSAPADRGSATGSR